MRTSRVASERLARFTTRHATRSSTDDGSTRRMALRAAVGEQHHVGREQLHDRFDVAARDGREQVADELVLARLVGTPQRDALVVELVARAARQLTARGG